MEIEKLRQLVKKLGRTKVAFSIGVSESSITSWLNKGIIGSGPAEILLSQLYVSTFSSHKLVLVDFLKERLSTKTISSVQQEIDEVGNYWMFSESYLTKLWKF